MRRCKVAFPAGGVPWSCYTVGMVTPPRAPRSKAWLLPLLVGALVATACGGARPTGLNVPLVYRPQSGRPEGLKSVEIPAGTKLFVARIVDGRTERRIIGANVEEKSRNVPVYGEANSPTAYVDEALSVELGRAGFSIVEREEDASLVLATTLTSFFVTEGGTYQAEVSAKVEVRDKAGKSLFEGRIFGTKSQWGKSLSVENYQEVLAKASVDFVANLVSNPGFRKALGAS